MNPLAKAILLICLPCSVGAMLVVSFLLPSNELEVHSSQPRHNTNALRFNIDETAEEPTVRGLHCYVITDTDTNQSYLLVEMSGKLALTKLEPKE